MDGVQFLAIAQVRNFDNFSILSEYSFFAWLHSSPIYKMVLCTLCPVQGILDF